MSKRSFLCVCVLVGASAGGWLAQPAVLGKARPELAVAAAIPRSCSFTILDQESCDWEKDGSIHCLQCGTGDPNGVACGGIYIIPTPPPAGFPSDCGGASMKSTSGSCGPCSDSPGNLGAIIDPDEPISARVVGRRR